MAKFYYPHVFRSTIFIFLTNFFNSWITKIVRNILNIASLNKSNGVHILHLCAKLAVKQNKVSYPER